MAFHDFSDPSKTAFRLDRFCEVALEFGRCHSRQGGPDHHHGVAKNMAQRLCLKRIIIEIGGMFGRSAGRMKISAGFPALQQFAPN